MNLKIFYSWQTETATTYNRNFILEAIQKAVKVLKRKPEFKDVEFIIQEGVKGEPGSPAVATKISDERIPNCDIFIADLSVVNQIGKFAKWIQKTFDKKVFRPSQNNNVINEYGIATNAIGVQKIIGVLNETYGSPNVNPDNIHFDIRHLRFPVSYNYSPKTKDKPKAQKELVDGLIAAISDTATFALQHQKSKHSPLMVWSDWEKSILTSESFIQSAKGDEISTLIKDSLADPKLTTRILGLSGLGKTRMLLEFFRPIQNDQDSLLLSSRILYINCNDNPGADFQAIFTKLNAEHEGRIVLLDNCSIEIHRHALSFAKRENNNTSFISLDSNPEEINNNRINGVNYIVIKKEDLGSVVDEILNRDFAGIGDENINKIKEFSQGIPLMAVLLAESVKSGETFVGKLDDKELLDKLLGAKGKEDRSRTILKACSIFNYFGFTDELAVQAEFMAKNKNITSLNGDDQVILNEFTETCEYYLKREIFERRGRFIGMRPFPLAMSLAQEWLEPCTPQRLTDVITAIANLPEPSRANLSEALSEQMKYLGYSSKAVSIVDKIIGPGSPFDDAEVLNTELGSRLFRSFVEVNPEAVGANFKRAFSNLSTSDLLKIVNGRRNLVWVLEKLCFDKRTFHDGIKVLYDFAVAENETWANNATGQFLQLFNVHLAGTEVDLKERWSIIEWGLNKGIKEYTDLAIGAMKVGLNYGHFSRMGGAESQGSKKLVDYPAEWPEIEWYWNQILQKLTEIVKSGNEYSDSAGATIADRIRIIFHVGLGNLIIPYIKDISEYKRHDWDIGLQGLKVTKKYESKFFSDEELSQVDGLIELLTKRDFINRYRTIAASYYLENDESYSEEGVKKNIVELADEFIRDNLLWDEAFPFFYKNQQVYSYYFGKRIYELLSADPEKVELFISTSITIIKQIEKAERNLTVLGGFIAESSNEIKKAFYDELFASDELSYLLFYFVSIDVDGKLHLELLFKLIDDDRASILDFYVLSYCRALSNMSIDELNEFSEKLMKYGDEGYAVAFDLIFDLGYNNKEKKQELLPFFKKCIYKLGVHRQFKRQMDDFKWTEAFNAILLNRNETEFAQFINKSVITSISWQNSYHLDHYIQKVYDVLVKEYFEAIWPDLSNALLSDGDEYIKFYGLKHILGSHIGGVSRLVGILFVGDIEAIFKWCDEQQPVAPSRLAELVPIFDGNNNNYSAWNPIALRLINEFGEIKGVLTGLNTNMGTYSWTGSSVPLLEAKRDLFTTLVDHPKTEVKEWANSYISYLEKEIEHEKIRDAESFL